MNVFYFLFKGESNTIMNCVFVSAILSHNLDILPEPAELQKNMRNTSEDFKPSPMYGKK